MKILYVDQTGQLGGGELALLPWIIENSAGACVALFEDGPFRTLLEDRGVAVEVLALNTLKKVRRESGIVPVLLALPAFVSLYRRLAKLAASFEVLYANSQKAFLVAAMAKRRKQPLVWHLRDILTREHFHPILRKLWCLQGTALPQSSLLIPMPRRNPSSQPEDIAIRSGLFTTVSARNRSIASMPLRWKL